MLTDMGTPHRNYAAKLSIPGKSNDELTYAFHESSLEHQHALLTLFGVFSITSTSEHYQLLIGETVKHFLDYYRRTAESPSSPIKQDGINSREFLFENAIQYTYERVTHALLEDQDERGKTQGIDMKKVHFLLGAICEGQLYASITGSGIHALYFYPVYQKHGFSHYASVDAIHGNKEHADLGGSSRLFSSMISGSVAIPRSILAVCNQAFLNYISVEQLKQAVTGNPIEAVAPYFQRLLGKIHAKNDFCALFLDAHYTPSVSARTHQQTVSNESMAVLNSKEEGTEKILFPAFAGQIKNLLSLLWNTLIFCVGATVRWLRRWIPRAYSVSRAFILSLLKKKKSARARVGQQLAQSSKDSSSEYAPAKPLRGVIQEYIARSAANIWKYLSSLIHAGMQVSIRLFQTVSSSVAKTFSVLPQRSKTLLFISILFLTLFGISIILIQRSNAERRQQNVYDEMLRIAEEKNSLAEASLIYDNTEKARALLTEAQQALREYPADGAKRQERYQTILKRIQTIIERTNRITPLNLTMLADFNASIPYADQLKLASSNSRALLYAASGAYTVDLANGALAPLQTQTKIPSLSCGIGLAKTDFYLCDVDAKRMFLLDAISSAIRQIPFKPAKGETALDAIALYNQRLYVLSAPDGILFRHQKNKNGFESGIPILKNLAIDPQAISFAIDGSIYILERNGQISKYTAGKKELFILPFLDPPPARFEKIWTDTDVSSLYVLDPPQKRILVIDKDTRVLKMQLVSDALATARDIAFLPKKKLVLVLDKATLYQAPLDMK